MRGVSSVIETTRRSHESGPLPPRRHVLLHVHALSKGSHNAVDTYSHPPERVGRQAAEAGASLVLRTNRRPDVLTACEAASTEDSGRGLARVKDPVRTVGRLGIEPRTRGLKDAPEDVRGHS